MQTRGSATFRTRALAGAIYRRCKVRLGLRRPNKNQIFLGGHHPEDRRLLPGLHRSSQMPFQT
jgi:hypothetical protein